MKEYDIAIIGSGFSGSIIALIARRLGLTVALVERYQHPRFAIGESSTPLANLLLEEIGKRFKIPELINLTNWGRWQAKHSDLACGLKRGFSFYHHTAGNDWTPMADRSNELLVAASPHDKIADTHWYRQDFDQHLLSLAINAGADYFDNTDITETEIGETGTSLTGQRATEEINLHARYIIDSSGPRGHLHSALNLPPRKLSHLPSTEFLFTHFKKVKRWEHLFRSKEAPPYPVDDSALHHLFEGGWIWVLHFNNGTTSAGASVSSKLASELGLSEGKEGWNRLLARFPSIAEQFKEAEPTHPFQHKSVAAFITSQANGPGWAMVPSAAGFIDPIFSTGFPLTLLGVLRIGDALRSHWDSARFENAMNSHGKLTLKELQMTEQFLGVTHSLLGDFGLFTALSMLYFSALSYTETVRRLGNPFIAGKSFFMQDHPQFGPALKECLDLATPTSESFDRSLFLQKTSEAIDTINIAGLNNAEKKNWYGVDAEDLFANVDKLETTREEIESMLKAAGFHQRG